MFYKNYILLFILIFVVGCGYSGQYNDVSTTYRLDKTKFISYMPSQRRLDDCIDSSTYRILPTYQQKYYKRED